MKPKRVLKNASGSVLSKFDEWIESVVVNDQAGYEHDRLEINLHIGSERSTLPILEFPPKGFQFTVELGYEQVRDVDPKYSGFVSNLGTYKVNDYQLRGGAKSDTFSIVCHGVDLKNTSLKTTRTSAYNNENLKQILELIAARNNMTLVFDPSIANIDIPHLDQYQESDQAFLTKLATASGGVSKFIGDNLIYFGRKGNQKTITGIVTPSFSIHRDEVLDYTYNDQSKSTYTGVRVVYQDQDNPPSKTVLVGNETSAVKENSEVYSNEAEATEAARAQLSSLNREGKTMEITLIGNPRIQTDTKINLVGFHPQVLTNWVVNKVTHTWGTDAAVTKIALENPDKTSEDEGEQIREEVEAE